MIQPLVISAPFGNYVQPHGATATLGTFTLERRPGRLWRVLRTVRYYPGLGAWVNKIGLRNPGIGWLEARAGSGRARLGDKIVSIHGFAPDDWAALLDRLCVLRPMAIELNMSCPNVGHVNWPGWLFARAVRSACDAGSLVVVKLPPVNYRAMFDDALAAGVRVFHCCNTIPVPAGGVSGKPLKPVAIACIVDCLGSLPAALRGRVAIIGGGGITTPADIDDYAAAGAARVAVGTKVFKPWYLWSHRGIRPLIEHARARLTGREGPLGAPAAGAGDAVH
ncbi:MAG: hypothetical protein IBJ11_12125 [Phycisphaerales bacterium]|nr:hypothetical protein [Phycisphaerales bacterium]